jgi:hypothetical protein
MKKQLALSAVLILGAISSYGSQSRTGYQSQFHVPHVKKQIQAHLQEANTSKSGAPSSAAHSLQARPAAVTGHIQAHVARPKPHTNSSVSTIGFVSATEIGAGGGAGWQALAADVNGDGNKDVVSLVENYVSGSWVYSISVVLSNGDGTFQAPALTTLTTGDPILVGDVSGDGKDDVIQAHPGNSPSTFDVWLSDTNGDGKFTQANNYQISSTNLQGGILTDVNGDGKLDILAIDSQTPGLVWTLLGNGDGTFQAGTSVALAGSSPYNLIFADFNGDGKIDFAGFDNNNQVNIYLQSAGNFLLTGTPLTTLDAVYNSCNLTAGDLNADGKAEIVSSNCYDNNLTVYVNNGDGTFQTGVYYAPGVAPKTGTELSDTAAGLYPEAATIADVNGDGKNDIVVSNDDSSDVTILLGNGDGTVTVPSIGYAVGGYPRTPAVVADFNGDGLQDIIVTDDEHSFVYLQGYGDGTFRAALNYYSPIVDNSSAFNNYAYGITVANGDFNGDGLPDVVLGICCESNVGITVFLSRPDGSLQPGVNYGTGGGLEYVAVADFNGDTKLDIAATDRNNNVVQIFTGNGDGTFATANTFATDTAANPSPNGIVSGDFNHDGKIDLAIVNSNQHDIGVLLGDGTGNFSTPTPYALSQYAYEITAADLNGDGYLDLLVPLNNSPSNGVAVLLANSDNTGTFKAESDVAIGYGRLYSAAVGDLNGDGKMDLAVTVDDNSNNNQNQGIAVALGNGDGTFQPATLYASTSQDVSWDGPWPAYVKMLDFDNDGKLDLIYTNSEYGTVGVMFGFGDGTFSSPTEYASGGYAYGLTLADVNGDGATDVVTAGDDFAGVTVLLNNSGTGTQANFAVAADTNTATVAAGSPATYNLSLTGKNGYNGTVTFSCSGLPAKASCAFSPASVVANGNLPQSTALTITTTAATAYFVQPVRPNSKPSAPTFWASLSGLGVFGLVLAGDGKKSNRRQMAIVLGILLLVMMFSLVGCSGGGSSSGGNGGGGGGTPGTPAGTYAVTVTATGTGSSAPTHTMNLTLIVQ